MAPTWNSVTDVAPAWAALAFMTTELIVAEGAVVVAVTLTVTSWPRVAGFGVAVTNETTIGDWRRTTVLPTVRT